mmetsp:Transcript_16000/g.60968  ORF Transcript_16000/g.60968 Transcript_16000/m.60968 type:complete len:215 (+) Transcript_16000:4088-4732(+)
MLFGRHVSIRRDLLDAVEVRLGGLDHLELRPAFPRRLDARICPQRCQVFPERHVDLVFQRRLHHHVVGVSGLDLSRNAEGLAGFAHGFHGLDDVPVHKGLVLLALALAEAHAVQDLHLLKDGGLAALASAEQQKLDLLVLRLEVLVHLVVNLPGLVRGILLLGRQLRAAGTHSFLALAAQNAQKQADGPICRSFRFRLLLLSLSSSSLSSSFGP